MKERTVTLQLETKNDSDLKDLRRASAYRLQVVAKNGVAKTVRVIQAQADVIKEEK